MRLSISLSDWNHSVLQTQANVLGISLSSHINNMLRETLENQLQSLENTLKKLESD